MMRILILHSRYLSGSLSGENSVVDDEGELLRSEGHDVTVYSPSVNVDHGRTRIALEAVWSRSHAAEVARLVATTAPDVVHVHSLYPALSPAVIQAVPAGTPVVMTLHNFRYSCLPATFMRQGNVCVKCLGRSPIRGVIHRCYRGSAGASAALAASMVLHRALGSLERIDLFLAVSAFVRSRHIEAGLPPERIRVKPNFAPPATRRRQGGGEYFLVVGRLTPEKGVETAVAAARARGHSLVVVGDGPMRTALEKLAGAETTFLGSVERDKIPSILSEARALLVPSRWYEGSPRVIVEAFAAGVGIVASRIGGLPELLGDSPAGLLVPPEDTGAWAAALDRYVDGAEAERAGEAAYRLWQARFSPASAIRDLEAAYSAAIG